MLTLVLALVTQTYISTYMEESPDFFAQIDKVDKRRRQKDIFLKLLTDDDNVELQRHVLGIVASSPDETETKQLGLLFQLFGNSFDQKQSEALMHVQRLSLDDLCVIESRVQCHFVLFVTLGTSNEFVEYVLTNSQDATAVRYFIEEILQKHLADLMHSISALKESDAVNVMIEFVEKCRCDYMCHCMSGST